MRKQDSFYLYACRSFLTLLVALSTGSSVICTANASGLSRLAAMQKQPQIVAGAPLKGVDVKLGRYAGAQFGGNMLATQTTNDKGEFNFGVVPAGTYYLTLSRSSETARKHDAAMAAIQNTRREINPPPANLKDCLLTIQGATGGEKTVGWNFEKARTFDPLASATDKTATADKIIVESNGRDPLRGTCTTVVKSKSNITNN